MSAIKTMRWSFGFLSCALLAICGFAGEADSKAAPNIQTDVVYGKTGGVELKLDIAVPPGEGPFPLIVCIHGGGWAAGSKSSYGGLIRAYASRGYVAASIGYRLAPAYKLPSQVEDVKCAVRFLRANAQQYKINKDKVGSVGGSAGGHLSLMLGLTETKDGLEGDGGCPNESSKVQAVVNHFGPTDLRVDTTNPAAIRIASNALGTTDPKSPVVSRASPVVYIDKNDPPVLTCHGSKDPLVDVSQATILHDALKKAGVQERMILLEGAGHGFTGADLSRVNKETLAFFDKHLKGIEPKDLGPASTIGTEPGAKTKETKVAAISSTDDAKQQFVEHDKNKDGKLDDAELKALIASQGYPANVAKMILSRLDKDHDKQISESELVELPKQFGR